MTFREIKEIKDNIMSGGSITRSQAIGLLRACDIGILYHSANQLRAKFCGSKASMLASCDVAGLIGGNHLSAEALKVSNIIKQIRELGLNKVMMLELNTGSYTTTDKQVDEMIGCLNMISSEYGIRLSAAMGNISMAQLQRLKSSTKINGYRCDIETSERIFAQMWPHSSISDRYSTIKMAQEAGYKTCTGIRIGIGETMEERIDMALKIKDMGINAVTINVMMPLGDKQPTIGSQEILTTIALFRFVNPKSTLLLTSGNQQIKIIVPDALLSGANAVMVCCYPDSDVETDIKGMRKALEREGFVI